MKITEEQIKKAKEEYKNVYKGELSWQDETGKTHELEILYKEPTIAFLEAYSLEVQNSPVVANNNLFISLLIAPDSKEVKEKIANKTAVIAAFIEKEISPFFGSKIKTKTTKL